MCRARRVVALVGLVAAMAAVAATSAPVRAGAQMESPPATDPPATAVTGSGLDPAAVKVAIDLTRTRTKLDTADRAIAVAQARLTSAQTAFDLSNTEILAYQTRLVAVKNRLRERAVAAYQHGTSGNAALLEIDSVSTLSSAEHYASAALQVDDSDLANLDQIEQRLEDDRAQRAQELDELRTTEARLAADREDLGLLQQREQALLDQWGAVPVMGDAWLTPAQLAGWFRSTGATAVLAPGTTIDDVARLYLIEGKAEHVRGDLAFAQAVVETGSFRVAAGNNYAGIGVCDSCTGGHGFPTPMEGIRAQIQLLRNYADPDSRAMNLANPPAPGLYGDDQAKAAATYDSFFLKGRVPLWNQMGNGNWATDRTYARTVIEMFARLVAYAAGRPS